MSPASRGQITKIDAKGADDMLIPVDLSPP
jgi:hypothetical protein